jgi:hypothetical protein
MLDSISNKQITLFGMKSFIAVCLIVFVYSCGQKGDQSSQSGTDSTGGVYPPVKTSDSSWINSFNSFRNALYRGDKAGVKKFFSFPVLSEMNEIWTIVPESDPRSEPAFKEKITAFEESDFDKYFHEFFPQDVITSILKIKVKELYGKGSFETEEIRDTTDKQYSSRKMYSDFNAKEKTLVITLNWSVSSADDSDDGDFDAESSTTYVFDILSGGHLRFRAIHFAG